MDNARKARSRLVRALGVLGKSVRRERARVRINRDRTPQGVCLQTTRKELTWDDEPVELQTETEKR